MTNEPSMGTRVTQDTTRTISHEYVLGYEVYAYCEENEVGGTFSTHWSTPTREPIVKLFTEAQLRSALSIPDATPDGWVMVPREPNASMWTAGGRELQEWRSDFSHASKNDAAVLTYRAMLAAAPASPPIPSAKPDAWMSEDLYGSITALALANIPELGGDPSPLYPIPLFRGSNERVVAEASEIIADLVRLADMGFEASLKEPEENGNFAAYERAKRFLSRAALSRRTG